MKVLEKYGSSAYSLDYMLVKVESASNGYNGVLEQLLRDEEDIRRVVASILTGFLVLFELICCYF